MARVRFTSHLRRFFPKLQDGDFDGGSLAELVATLERAHPGLASYLVDDQGSLRQHVNVFVNDELVRDRHRLSDPIAPGTTISFFQALSGG
jgi:molybdopterin converting factor small subunit